MSTTLFGDIKNTVKASAPRHLLGILASVYYLADGRWRLVWPSGDLFVVKTHQDTFYTCREQIGRGGPEMRAHKYQRYQLPGFCSVGTGDFVIDVGSFIGEFSLPAAKTADRVVAVEPDPVAFRALKKNTSSVNNIIPINSLISDTEKMYKFKSAADPTESSLINVDQGEYETTSVYGHTIDSLVQNKISDIIPTQDQIDFIKIDAEGAEPEVLEGIKSTNVQKFAIDVGSERRGESTEKKVDHILQERGYDTKTKEDKNGDTVLFANLNR
ncbi:FkbM family methyltransferase [Halovenus sp. HT40]|uniref:FkbM family methyltransferase n=1 Tax=Halovenus sp. HT40 TaxID=3126691 RepID=UPI00300F4B9F